MYPWNKIQIFGNSLPSKFYWLLYFYNRSNKFFEIASNIFLNNCCSSLCSLTSFTSITSIYLKSFLTFLISWILKIFFNFLNECFEKSLGITHIKFYNLNSFQFLIKITQKCIRSFFWVFLLFVFSCTLEISLKFLTWLCLFQ